jgi:hypothetical protein
MRHAKPVQAANRLIFIDLLQKRQPSRLAIAYFVCSNHAEGVKMYRQRLRPA